MTEFLKLLPPVDAYQLFFDQVPLVHIRSEKVEVAQALGRVAAEDVRSPEPAPSFRRSTKDGYAVIAGDTYGASDTLPAYLKLVGEVLMGQETDLTLHSTETAIIHTGGMIPEGADGVVMVEYTQHAGDEVEIYRPVAVGENIVQVGEDIQEGQVILEAGRKIRPAEIGGLLSLGITEINVAVKPRVGIISSGDEVISPEEAITPGKVRDINTHTLGAVVKQAGGEPVLYGVVPDDDQSLREVVQRAWMDNDLVVVTAGSSVSVRDNTAKIIQEIGSPGVLVHGVNIRPGKPTILAICDGKPVVGLPGNPVSALSNADLYVRPIIEHLQGMETRRVPLSIPARLSINVPSIAGREDWIPVRITEGEGGYTAEPIFFESNFIFRMVKGDGLARIPEDANGLQAGEIVQVRLI